MTSLRPEGVRGGDHEDRRGGRHARHPRPHGPDGPDGPYDSYDPYASYGPDNSYGTGGYGTHGPHDSHGTDSPYGTDDPYGVHDPHTARSTGADAFEEAVRRLGDPLNDPLPGQEPAPRAQPHPALPPEPGGTSAPSAPYAEPQGYAYGPYPTGRHRAPAADAEARPPRAWYTPEPAPRQEPAPLPPTPRPEPAPAPTRPDDATVALRTLRRGEAPVLPERSGGPADRSGTEPLRPPGGGRAARRRAQRERERRANQNGPMVVASQVLGEVFITLGVVMLLFVSYQLWWTNVLAGRQAGSATESLEERWKADGVNRDPGVFSPGQGFAILYIPKLDVKVPIAEGIDKQGVLDRGMVGHYAEEPLETAMPWEEKGNFAVAGHRNTHGEPFRYINKLEPGDPIVVETQSTYFVYEMANRLDSTLPSNVSVIDPVPPESGFKEPGRYITLTTCTPEFTSKYRLIVWGRMVDERPRSKGKPDALVG